MRRFASITARTSSIFWYRYNIIPCVRRKTFLVFEETHSLCSKKHIPCVPTRTFLVLQRNHLLCSKQNICCVLKKTFPVFQARHLLCSKENNSCAPQKTSPVFRSPKNAHATFRRIRPIVPRFVGIIIRFAQILGRSAEFAKKWHAKFVNFERLKNREDGSDFDDSWTVFVASSRSKFSRRRKQFCENEFFFAANARTDGRTPVTRTSSDSRRFAP